jgi:hypothetical protein
MIYFCEILRQRTIVYIVSRNEIATFNHGELTSNNRTEKLAWGKAKTFFPRANLALLELASGESPPPGSGWLTEIVVLDQATVTTYGGIVHARNASRIVGHDRAHVNLFDTAVGFAFSKTHLFPRRDTTAIAVDGIVVPQEREGANCFIGPEAILPGGWPHHLFDGTQEGFEAEWRLAFPTNDPPKWPR